MVLFEGPLDSAGRVLSNELQKRTGVTTLPKLRGAFVVDEKYDEHPFKEDSSLQAAKRRVSPGHLTSLEDDGVARAGPR